MVVAGSAIALALTPLTERAAIPLIAVGASNSKVVQRRRYSFIHWVAPETEAQVMVEEMMRHNYQRFAAVNGEQEGIIAWYNALHAEMERRGIANRILFDDRYLTTATDFRTTVSKAKAKKVDGIIVALFPGAIASLAKELRASGLKADLIGAEVFEDEHEVRASDGALIGHWYVNADDPTLEFLEAYRAAYNESPGWATANSYDVVMLLSSAVTERGSAADDIVHFLENLKDYSGSAGIYSATGDHRFTLPAAIKRITAKGFEKIR